VVFSFTLVITATNHRLARGNLTDLHHLPDIEFQERVAGFRRLSPACDQLTRTSSANNFHCMQDADKAVVQLLNEYCMKWTNIIKRPDRRCPQVLGVPPAQLPVPDLLLSADAPPATQWGLATPLPNPCTGTTNPPPAHAPRPPQIQATALDASPYHNCFGCQSIPQLLWMPVNTTTALDASPYHNPPPLPNSQVLIQLPLPGSCNHGPSGSSIQNIPLPAKPSIKFRLRSCISLIHIKGAPTGNNHLQMLSQVMVNNLQ